MRLNKFIALTCGLARRKADELIAEGRVYINGLEASPGTQVSDIDEVTIDGERIKQTHEKIEALERKEKVLIAYYKPRGIECTLSEEVDGNLKEIFEDVLPGQRLLNIGRLDKDSEGLLLLTNHAPWVHEMTHAKFDLEKEYEVEISRPLTPHDLERLSLSFEMDGYQTQPAKKIKQLGKNTFLIVLGEGRNRQIRRMVESLGARVRKLVRTRQGKIKLGKLRPGEWHYVQNFDSSKK